MKAPDRYFRPDWPQVPVYRTTASVSGATMLHRNESAIQLPQALRDEILQRLAAQPWNRYPEISQNQLRDTAREALGLAANLDVLFGNGSNEIIQSVLAATIAPGDAVVIPQPTYAMYERVTRLRHGVPVFVPPRADLGLSIDQILDTARRSEARLVMLCRPNNPTGTCVSLDEVERLAAAADCLLLVDEAYVEFAGDSALDVAQRYENVILSRTMSKALRCAGLRIGYAIGNAAIMESVGKAIAPYNLSTAACEAAQVLLRERSGWLDTCSRVAAERDRVRARLAHLPGASVLPSHTNFLCVRTPWPGTHLTERLAERRVMVRDISGFPGLEDAVRITIGTADENDRMLQAITEVWEVQ